MKNKKEFLNDMLFSFKYVFVYEGLLQLDGDSGQPLKNCWLVLFIKSLREVKTEYADHYTLTDLKNFNKQFDQINAMTDIYDTFKVFDRHTVIWQMLVQMFGNYGESPRTGWIDQKTECADFLQSLIAKDGDATWIIKNLF